jgi:hypothetical protein
LIYIPSTFLHNITRNENAPRSPSSAFVTAANTTSHVSCFSYESPSSAFLKFFKKFGETSTHRKQQHHESAFMKGTEEKIQKISSRLSGSVSMDEIMKLNKKLVREKSINRKYS